MLLCFMEQCQKLTDIRLQPISKAFITLYSKDIHESSLEAKFVKNFTVCGSGTKVCDYLKSSLKSMTKVCDFGHGLI